MPAKPEDRFEPPRDGKTAGRAHWKAKRMQGALCDPAEVPQGASIYTSPCRDPRFAWGFHGMHHILLSKMPKADGAEHELRLVLPGAFADV